MHYFISAGEASGDIHAAQLICELKKLDSDARFTFLGGDLMAEASGSQPVIHYRRMAFMGICEVIRNLRTVLSNLTAAKKAMADSKPDCFIAIDYPSFNLKLAKYANRLNIPVYYYIAPKVWAWKEWRVKQLRRYVKRIISILPFEQKYFSSKGIHADYAGNPSLEEVDRKLASIQSADNFRNNYGLDSRPILAIVPGSRRGEIRNNLPIMDSVATRHPELQPVIAGAPGLAPELYDTYSSIPVIEGHTFEIMRHSTAALVTSGTATLECALAGTPQVVCYRSNGSRLTYNIMKRLLKIKHVSLPNLIADREVIPEMLMHLCTTDSIDAELIRILPSSPERDIQLDGYRDIRTRLGDRMAAPTAAKIITDDLSANLKTR